MLLVAAKRDEREIHEVDFASTRQGDEQSVVPADGQRRVVTADSRERIAADDDARLNDQGLSFQQTLEHPTAAESTGYGTVRGELLAPFVHDFQSGVAPLQAGALEQGPHLELELAGLPQVVRIQKRDVLPRRVGQSHIAHLGRIAGVLEP